MAVTQEIVFTSIRDMSKLVNVGNENAILALALSGTSQAKLLAPVKDGLLRNSIQYIAGTGKRGGLNDSGGDIATTSLSARLRRWEAAIGATAEYAVYVEFGTRFQSPQVYLRSSLAILAGVATSVVKEKMDEEFKLGPLKYGQERTKF